MADAAAGIAWLYEFAIEAGTPVEQGAAGDAAMGAARAGDGQSQQPRLGDSRRSRSSWPRRAGSATRWSRRCVRPPMDHATRLRSTRPASRSRASCVAVTCEHAGGGAAGSPLSLSTASTPRKLLVQLNRPEEALAYAENVLRLETDMPYALIRKGLALIELGRAADLAALIPTLQRQAHRGPRRSERSCRWSRRRRADRRQRRRKARRARPARAAGPESHQPVHGLSPGPGLARAGTAAPTGALAALERHAEHGRVPYDFLRLSPDFKALAANERFVRALGIARAQFDDTVAVLKEADARSELPPFMRQPLTDLLRTLGIRVRGPASSDPAERVAAPVYCNAPASRLGTPTQL